MLKKFTPEKKKKSENRETILFRKKNENPSILIREVQSLFFDKICH